MEPALIRAQILRISLFDGLPQDLGKHAVNVLSRICEVRTLPSKSVLFTEGEALSDMGYILLRGEVLVRKSGSPDLQVSAPELLGEMKQFSPVGQRTVTVEAKGELEVSNLVVPLVDRNSIGGYKAEFFTQESGVIASIEDTDGVVDVAGSLNISTDGSYEFFAQLGAKSETPDKLRQQMQFLGNELRLEGQL